ncbi:terminase [Vibrio parahaemolyticus]|uniref:terminase large subunit n=1 Tax=Vibrio parahaemolyticus TaxID=670 RepID=UPI00111F6D22|nr:terminase TerL endonuclease subunit [Vibrio parahaemolyticus]EGS6497210.1 terminase large subunit [Vibrio parahaemolyticus]ELF4876463.1 terminase large subunit [Vibrio parahaemolyticus]TOE16192.1 terminase [Vibrio parahaemolyticus]TOI00948.1 terminase [Vibrio parahaemolyticus]TOJ04424.1 terminase [Vibrio parahaemolyticus]
MNIILREIAEQAYTDAFDYAEQILTGEIPACKNVINAMKRFKADLQRCEEQPDYIRFDKQKALEALAFFSSLPHVKGEWSGKRIHLMPFHSFIIVNIYGFELKRTKGWTRRFRKAHLSVPRKSAKSTMAAGIALNEMMRDSGAEVYSAARTRDMARICWRDAAEMINKSPILKQFFTSNKSIIEQRNDNSFYKPLSSDTNVLDGLNTQAAIIDELHLLDTEDIYGVMETSMGARREPLLVSITTAGFNLNGFCYSLEKEYLEPLLRGDTENDSFFALMYGIDDGDDVFDEATWYKANPALGISKSIDDLRDLATRAKQQASALVQFKTKHLNMWVSSGQSWLDMDVWKAAPKSLPDEELIHYPCYVGIDLARETDFTAIVAVFDIGDGTYDIRPHMLLPEESIHKGSSTYQSLLAKFVEKGDIILTDGNVMDEETIVQTVQNLATKYSIREVVFDQQGSTGTQVKLYREGFNVMTVSQSTKTFTPAMVRAEALIVSRRLRNPRNSAFNWMMGNVVLKYPDAKSCYPAKPTAEAKIDAPVAMLMGLNRALLNDDGDINDFINNPIVI